MSAQQAPATVSFDALDKEQMKTVRITPLQSETTNLKSILSVPRFPPFLQQTIRDLLHRLCQRLHEQVGQSEGGELFVELHGEVFKNESKDKSTLPRVPDDRERKRPCNGTKDRETMRRFYAEDPVCC